MLTYDFEQVDGPLYEYIYQRIKEDILDGVLKAGEKLPSKRTFAGQNGVSTITVQNAYDQLISEGYVYTQPKKGYYVSYIFKSEQIADNMAGSSDIKVPERKEHFNIDLSNNGIDPSRFPFSVWAKLMRETMSVKKSELMVISPSEGKKELRYAIAEHLKSFRGMLVSPDQIIIGAGTEYLYSFLIQLLGREKRYCIENPGYKKLVKIYGAQKITCQFAPVDDRGMTVDGLKACHADIAHMSPNHHFPTGITMPVSRRYEMLAWAGEQNDRYIIEDDYDSEFRMNGKPIPTLFSMDRNGKVIYMNTFSKSLTPTIRISYMVLPVSLANLFYEKLSFYACTVSNFEQLTLAEFIRKGYFEKHINRMRLYYRRQRKQVMDVIANSALAPISTIVENDSGLHFLLHLDTEMEDRVLTEKLREKEILLHALSEYELEGKTESTHMFIINYSNVMPEKVSQASEIIYRCIYESEDRTDLSGTR